MEFYQEYTMAEAYSTVGFRGDCDMVLWRICYNPEDLNQMSAELMATPMAVICRPRIVSFP
jgi:chlorite dismutase